MIAVDTSALSRWLNDIDDWSTRIVRRAVYERLIYLPSIVLTEALSNRELADADRAFQSCIDRDIPLITYDRDFRHFLRAGLKLVQQES